MISPLCRYCLFSPSAKDGIIFTGHLFRHPPTHFRTIQTLLPRFFLHDVFIFCKSDSSAYATRCSKPSDRSNVQPRCSGCR